MRDVQAVEGTRATRPEQPEIDQCRDFGRALVARRGDTESVRIRRSVCSSLHTRVDIFFGHLLR